MLPRIYAALSSRLPAAFSAAWFTTTMSSSTPTKSASIQEFVDSTIDKANVVIFSKSSCPYCRRAKNLFSENFPDVKPEIVELDEHDDGSAIQKYLHEKTGQRTVPNIFVRKQHIGGSDDTTAAFKSGKLTGLLKATAQL